MYHTLVHGSLVKGLRRCPLTAETGVRFPYELLDPSVKRYLDFSLAGVSELADEADSKSVGGNIVWVQVPSPA